MKKKIFISREGEAAAQHNDEGKREKSFSSFYSTTLRPLFRFFISIPRVR